MSPINPVGPLSVPPVTSLDQIEARALQGPTAPRVGPVGDSFGKLLDGLLSDVVARDNAADAATRSVLLGEGTPLHQAQILGAEADVSFLLMVEMRNKLLESYQELMRMQL
ncbi:MAG TPA: flagellar hook-basal body complex protein FliE [Opitutaceae bacterium]|nr:flagellar hook-basal body complex protein FliE [Opitutaceae bacterium]